MKIHRFIDNFDLSKNELEITGENAKQMAQVLKLKIGEKVELCDGKGISAIAEITKINKKGVLVKLEEFLHQNKDKQKKEVTLYCAILKKENFELVVQKTTECGISKIIPIITERTIKTGLNIERLQKIAKEASEQSGRNNVPEVSEPIKLEEAIKNTKGINVFFDSSGDSLLKAHGYFSASETNVNLFVGPEGGWTPKEIKKAKENNFSIASLGSLTLRGETAAIIATYLMVNSSPNPGLREN